MDNLFDDDDQNLHEPQKGDLFDDFLEEVNNQANMLDQVEDTLTDIFEENGGSIQFMSMADAVAMFQKAELDRQEAVRNDFGDEDFLMIVRADESIQYIDLKEESGWNLFSSMIADYAVRGEEDSVSLAKEAISASPTLLDYLTTLIDTRDPGAFEIIPVTKDEKIVECLRGNVLDIRPGAFDCREYAIDGELHITAFVRDMVQYVKDTEKMNAMIHGKEMLFAEDGDPIDHTFYNVRLFFGEETAERAYQAVFNALNGKGQTGS